MLTSVSAIGPTYFVQSPCGWRVYNARILECGIAIKCIYAAHGYWMALTELRGHTFNGYLETAGASVNNINAGQFPVNYSSGFSVRHGSSQFSLCPHDSQQHVRLCYDTHLYERQFGRVTGFLSWFIAGLQGKPNPETVRGRHKRKFTSKARNYHSYTPILPCTEISYPTATESHPKR